MEIYVCCVCSRAEPNLIFAARKLLLVKLFIKSFYSNWKTFFFSTPPVAWAGNFHISYSLHSRFTVAEAWHMELLVWFIRLWWWYNRVHDPLGDNFFFCIHLSWSEDKQYPSGRWEILLLNVAMTTDDRNLFIGLLDHVVVFACFKLLNRSRMSEITTQTDQRAARCH